MEVQRVVKTGRSVFDPVCGIRFLKNTKPDTRFAVVAGTKVHKSAVKRNRIKRQYREILRLNLENIVKGYDVVFFVSAQALELTYAQKEERLIAVLKRARLWAK